MDEVDSNQKRRGLLEYTLHPTSPMISLRIPRRRYLALPTAGEPPDERLNRNPGAGRLEESTGRRPWTLPDFFGRTATCWRRGTTLTAQRVDERRHSAASALVHELETTLLRIAKENILAFEPVLG